MEQKNKFWFMVLVLLVLVSLIGVYAKIYQFTVTINESEKAVNNTKDWIEETYNQSAPEYSGYYLEQVVKRVGYREINANISTEIKRLQDLKDYDVLESAYNCLKVIG